MAFSFILPRMPLSSFSFEYLLFSSSSEWLSSKFDMLREIKTSDFMIAASYAYLEHILRITTPKLEADRLIKSFKGNMKPFLQEMVKKKETQAQEPLHNLENSVSYDDLARIDEPKIAIIHYQTVNGHLRSEEIFPENGRFPVCYIYSLHGSVYLLYTYQMTCLDGFDPFTAEKRYPMISEDMAQSFAVSLYVENNGLGDMQRNVMKRDEYVPSVVPVPISRRDPSPHRPGRQKSTSPMKFQDSDRNKGTSKSPLRTGKKTSRSPVRFQDSERNKRKSKSPQPSESRQSRSMVRFQDEHSIVGKSKSPNTLSSTASRSPIRSSQDRPRAAKLEGSFSRKSPSPLPSRNMSHISSLNSSSMSSSSRPAGNTSIMKVELDIIELDKSESSSDSGTDVKFTVVDNKSNAGDRGYRFQDRSVSNNRTNRKEEGHEQPRSSYQDIEIKPKPDKKLNKSWKPTFEKWDKVERRVLERQKKRDQCAVLDGCMII